MDFLDTDLDKIDIDDLQDKKFEKIKEIGKGAQGVIDIVKETTSNEIFARKTVFLTGLTKEERREMLKESILCYILKQENITECFGSIRYEDKVETFYEYSRYGDLYEYLKKVKRMVKEGVQQVAKDILKALQYCHSLNICHHDLKLENILIFDGPIFKLTDWGLSKHISEEKDIYGTLVYTAPEVFLGKGYFCDKTDMWSLGVILFMCIEGYNPYDVGNKAQNMREILNNQIAFDEADKDTQEFILKLLNSDPKKRPSAKEALKDKWFNS